MGQRTYSWQQDAKKKLVKKLRSSEFIVNNFTGQSHYAGVLILQCEQDYSSKRYPNVELNCQVGLLAARMRA